MKRIRLFSSPPFLIFLKIILWKPTYNDFLGSCSVKKWTNFRISYMQTTVWTLFRHFFVIYKGGGQLKKNIIFKKGNVQFKFRKEAIPCDPIG